MGNPEKHVTIKEGPEEAKLPSPANPPWNSEEDHLLSYFLDADSAGRRRSNSDLSSNNNPSPRLYHHPGAPTMTPAVQFYSGSSTKPPTPPQPQHPGNASMGHQQQQPPQPDSSLSSMASMAAALVGGPVFPAPGAKEEDSTISPTADLINGSNENLMLPAAQGQPTEADKQQHLAWLQQINAMAVMARNQAMPHAGGMPMPAAPGIPPVPTAPHGYPPLPPHHHHALYPPVPAAETEEKRARRLARNRESARASRRRKKERLATLEKQVTSLFSQVETQRREKIMEMEHQLQARRTDSLNSLSSRQDLEELLRETGPNAVVRERVANFQYEKLRQLLLPRHYEFLLWLTLQEEAFFNTAKNAKAGLANNKAGRVSSKQIGEELTNEAKKGRKQNIEEEEDKMTSQAHDVERMWPLLCFELLVSVDQEERLTQTQRKSREMPSLPDERLQMALATKMATNVRKGVLFQAHAASMRANTTLLDILTPEQSIKYLQWMASNRDKCRDTIQTTTSSKKLEVNNETLSDICKRLDEVLRFPKND